MIDAKILEDLQDMYVDPMVDNKYRETLRTVMDTVMAWDNVVRDIEYNKELYSATGRDFLHVTEGLNIALKIANKYLRIKEKMENY